MLVFDAYITTEFAQFNYNGIIYFLFVRFPELIHLPTYCMSVYSLVYITYAYAFINVVKPNMFERVHR